MRRWRRKRLPRVVMPHSGQTMMPSTMRRKGHFIEKVENLYRTAALRNNIPTRPYNSDHACAMGQAARACDRRSCSTASGQRAHASRSGRAQFRLRPLSRARAASVVRTAASAPISSTRKPCARRRSRSRARGGHRRARKVWRAAWRSQALAIARSAAQRHRRQPACPACARRPRVAGLARYEPFCR